MSQELEIIPKEDPYTKPSFSLTNRLRRLLWNTVCAVLFRPTPRQFFGWRVFLLRLFGAKIGKQCYIRSSVKIWAPWNLEMGDQSTFADGVTVYSMAKITLGDKVVVSQGTHLCSGSHDYESHTFQLFAKPITVYDRAWLCAESFVGPGVTVGEGAVLGARGVATRDLEPWTVYAGNPCKAVKPRVIRD